MKARWVVLVSLILLIAGCATTKQVSDLESRVGALESKLALPEQKAVTAEVAAPILEESQQISMPVTASKPSAASMTKKDVQLALKKAGFYTGAIDGQIGRNTRKAIKAFQKANGLTVDGIAGTKTKELLANYLTQ
jgi:peptidoglycan hydrolase-like protein with peptidoglycan-binding domain